MDWTDSLNPLRNPGWLPFRNQYAFDSTQDDAFIALRNAIGIEGRLWVCPDATHQLIPPYSTSDFQVPCEPNTWLFGLNAASNPGGTPDPAGFYVQVTDALTGAQLYSSPILNANLNGAATMTGDAAQCPLILLAAPRLFVPPSYPVVRVVNLSADAQTCVVLLFCAIETDAVSA